jgi:WD40 repeat protein
LWDVTSRQVLRELDQSPDLIAFAPDGKKLATVDDLISLWEPLSGALLHKLKGLVGRVRAIAFSPDSSTLAATSSDGHIFLWDANSGELIRTLGEFRLWKKEARGIAFSPDGRCLASTHYRFWGMSWPIRLQSLALHLPSGPETCLWHLQSGKVLHRLKSGVTPLAFSPDGETLVDTSYESLRFWQLDVYSGPRLRFQLPCASVYSLAYSPSGRVIASGALERAVYLWDVESENFIRELKDGEYKTPLHTQGIDTDFGAVTALAFSPDGSILAAGTNDGIIRLWNTDPRFDRARARIRAQSEKS